MKTKTAGVVLACATLILLGAATLSRAELPGMLGDKEMPSLAPMLENVTPAVVNIATEGRIQLRQNPLFADPFFQQFFNLPNRPIERKTMSLGSGVIVDDKRGLVLTNNHVIANAVQITVTLRDGRQLEAKLIGTDPETDVAVIKIPLHLLSLTELGSYLLSFLFRLLALSNVASEGTVVLYSLEFQVIYRYLNREDPSTFRTMLGFDYE